MMDTYLYWNYNESKGIINTQLEIVVKFESEGDIFFQW